MPILPAEPDLYPTDLWEHGHLPLPRGEDDADTPRWWCLHTKPRQEKATARYLKACGVAYYLPQAVHESRTPKGRKIRSVLPLFAGYVFLYGDRSAHSQSLKGNTLVGILEVRDQERLDGDLRQIRTMLSSGLPVVAEPTYSAGMLVRVLDGPLRGMVGVVERRGKGDRFVAIVDFLRQGAAVELHDWQVEPVEGSRPSSSMGGGHGDG